MRYTVVFDPAADLDLAELYDYLAPRAGRSVARRYIGQLVDYCTAFETFPARGTRHDDIGAGIRIVGFKRKASIVFRIDDDLVVIMRILHRGKSLGHEDEDDLA
ncbi:type II toxin-antitoxin system RelE/ParE family toxin [Neorhizobium sp. CSC1952]|uniref:type II toxin-antitoxin system RelE/ParE family toxin n=1 Tax=Neorhizobium sp. CSC1952 TaxID=2978974 RepID=UPI0025A612B2|nr:type II toxin-antitoxin system RelE/ParE family toxin [Rhizobium sp. CSC1952]WJR67731.1 type II toxin-antitoxin system RelE/ParE family toxin [Rhizobium sp. CSC1952]